MVVLSGTRASNLSKLVNKGRVSPKLKVVLKKLIKALKEHNQNKIFKLSMVHRYISSGWKQPNYPYNEDNEYNFSLTGTTAYRETDLIAHGDY